MIDNGTGLDCRVMNVEQFASKGTQSRLAVAAACVVLLNASLLLFGCAPNPPVVEPRAVLPVPASFGGVLPCTDCAGVRTDLRLRADGVVLMRQTFLDRASPDDDLFEFGRWRLRADGRVLLLEFGASTLNFAVLDTDRLAPLDGLGQPLGGGAAHELRRGDDTGAFEQPFRWRGTYRYMADAGIFSECRSGLALPVAQEGASAQLERAYLAARPGPGTGPGTGAELMFTLRGRLVWRPASEGDGLQEMLLVSDVDHAWPSEQCAAALRTTPIAGLEDTVWWLRTLDGARLSVPTEDRPRMRLIPANARVEAFGGCNVVFGSYTADSGRLEFERLASTRKHCSALQELEDRLLEVLRGTDGYIIDASELVLYIEGEAHARWASTAP